MGERGGGKKECWAGGEGEGGGDGVGGVRV